MTATGLDPLTAERAGWRRVMKAASITGAIGKANTAVSSMTTAGIAITTATSGAIMNGIGTATTIAIKH